MRKFIKTFGIFIFLSNSCLAEVNEPEIFKNPIVVKEVSASVIVLSSLERLLQDEVVVRGAKEAEIFCAKNEYESFQIIVTNPTDSPISKIDLNIDKWHFTGTPGEGPPELTLYREHYVEITKLSPRSKGRKGWYPDALIPFVDPYTGKEIVNAEYLARNQDVKSHKSQGYWIDVYVDKNVKAGEYHNEISVSANGKVIQQIPVIVHVWDFELPQVHKLKTYFGKMVDLSSYHGTSKDSNEYKTIEERYFLLLRDHGVSSVFQKQPQSFNKITGEAIFSSQYLSELKAFTQKFHPQMFKVPSFYSNDPIRLKGYLQSYAKFIKENPWVGQAFLYIDEPGDLKTYEMVKMNGQYLHQFAPSIKLLVTEQIKPEKPDYPSLEGSVDIWVPLWHLADPDDIRRRQAAGDEVWSYTALAQAEGVPVWLTDSPLLNYRAPIWSSYCLGLKGLLYWQTMAWASIGKDHRFDPWTNAGTYSSGGRTWNGEGSLLYPGKVAGIDGPVASMRLKILRDGLEDYDYFIILEKLAGKSQTDQMVEPIALSFAVFSSAGSDYIETRKIIAQKILERLQH